MLNGVVCLQTSADDFHINLSDRQWHSIVQYYLLDDIYGFKQAIGSYCLTDGYLEADIPVCNATRFGVLPAETDSGGIRATASR